MSREKLLQRLGFALIAGTFLWSCLNVYFLHSASLDPNAITIRFAHWQLEGGVRSALDAQAHAYERICAARGQKVRVEQLAIPETVYPNWFVTQLVGGTAPDILELGKNDSDDRKARYFFPLTTYLDEPNPYDKGTELETMPWKETFIGALANVYDQTLLDYYRIPMTITTTRMFYNVDLYKKICGDAPAPVNYAQFRELCVKVQDFGKAQKIPLLPIAGSRYNSPYVTTLLVGSQTQRMAEKINLKFDMGCDQEQAALAYLRGEWSLTSPEMQSGLKIVQDVSQFMQPGYLQLEREDATFYFVQGRALMLSTGSWDATSILQQAPFPVGVFQIPLPTPDDPQFGPFVRGQLSEAGSGVSVAFGLNRDSPHKDVALDFLKFVSSKQGAKIFTDASGWLPVIRGVTPDQRVRQFEPVVDGFIPGFILDLGGGGNTERVYENNFYRLLDQSNGLVGFTNAAVADYSRAVLDDIKTVNKNRAAGLSRSDTTLAAIWWRSLQRPADADLQRKLHELTELQTTQEMASALVDHTLKETIIH